MARKFLPWISLLENSVVHSSRHILLFLWLRVSSDVCICSATGYWVLTASSCTLACINHLASLGQSQKCRLPSGYAIKCDLKSLDIATECSCPKWIDVSMALLAAGMLSVNMIMSLHPVPVALLMARRIAKSSASSAITFPVGDLIEVIW